MIDEYQKTVLSASKYSEGLGTPSKRPSHWKYSHGKMDLRMRPLQRLQQGFGLIICQFFAII